MPNINITEVDLTSPGILNVTTNTAYVPGFAQYVPKDFDGRPRLYTSLAAFQEDFGSIVPMFGVNFGVEGVYQTKDATVARYDTGYLYAVELLRFGLPVLYHCIDCSYETELEDGKRVRQLACKQKLVLEKDGKYMLKNSGTGSVYNQDLSSITDTQIWQSIQSRITTDYTDEYGPGLTDKSFYNIKFITTGGYTGENYDMKAVAVAMSRGDCCAIIDHPHHSKGKGKFTPKNIMDNLPNLSLEQEKYSTMFTPYGYYSIPAISSLAVKTVEMPASFGYLLALASAVKTSPNWMAMAGCQRGQIPYLDGLAVELTEAQCKTYSNRDGVSINPITEVSPYGLIIWGNRTLYSNPQGNLTASSFLNIRNLCSDVKKTVWSASRQLTFEQNSDILWVKFKSLITPTLDQMVTGNGISAYQLKKRVAKQKATLSAVIRLYAIEAVEDFEIEIQLADSSTEILE